MTATTPVLVEVIRNNSEKVGKPNKKTGQRFTVNTEKQVTATLTLQQAELVWAALESTIREDATGDHRWWSVPSFQHVDAVLQLHQLNPQEVAAQ